MTLRRGRNRPARQAREIQASWKLLIKRAMCRCLRFANAPDVCSCKTCTTFEQMLFQYHKKRAGWHQAAARPCTKSNGTYHAGTLFRTHSGSPHTALKATTCPDAQQVHQSLPTSDHNDRIVGMSPSHLSLRLVKACPGLGEAATKIAAAIHSYVPDRRFLKHPPALCVLS